MIKTAHLFAGAGGGILADLVLGHEPKLAIEISKPCCRMLKAKQREGWLPRDMYIHCGDIRQFDWEPWAEKLDCIAAGFPCQDISCAGKGVGITGERSGLVWEVFRVIDAIKSSLVFLENSPCIRTRGRKEITAALVERGYCWRDGVLAASDIGAPHKRDRWWLLAADPDGLRQLEQERSQQDKWGWSGDSAEASADTFCIGLQRTVQCGVLSNIDAEAIEAAARYTTAYSWSPPDAGFCGMVDGVANQLDSVFRGSKRNRIAAASNGQVPLQAAAAWLILAHTM